MVKEHNHFKGVFIGKYLKELIETLIKILYIYISLYISISHYIYVHLISIFLYYYLFVCLFFLKKKRNYMIKYNFILFKNILQLSVILISHLNNSITSSIHPIAINFLQFFSQTFLQPRNGVSFNSSYNSKVCVGQKIFSSRSYFKRCCRIPFSIFHQFSIIKITFKYH